MKQPSIPQVNMSSLPPPKSSIDTATLELLAAWQQQDATTNSELIRAAEQELVEFKQAMNENRGKTGKPALYP